MHACLGRGVARELHATRASRLRASRGWRAGCAGLGWGMDMGRVGSTIIVALAGACGVRCVAVRARPAVASRPYLVTLLSESEGWRLKSLVLNTQLPSFSFSCVLCVK